MITQITNYLEATYILKKKNFSAKFAQKLAIIFKYCDPIIISFLNNESMMLYLKKILNTATVSSKR